MLASTYSYQRYDGGAQWTLGESDLHKEDNLLEAKSIYCMHIVR